jgi:outer membrane protein assembly factor BamB
MLPKLPIALVLAALLVASAAAAENWPQFRGPDAQSTPQADQLPTEWSADKNIAWKVAVPGTGWSQPIVWGDKIFVTTAVTENQRKPRPGFGGFGGRGGPGGPGGPGDFPRRPRDKERDPADAKVREKAKEKAGDKERAKAADKDPPSKKEDRRKEGEGPGKKEDRPRGFGPGGPGRGGPGGGPGRGFGRNPEPPNAVYQWKVLCLDAKTGDVVWERLAHEGRPTIATQASNTYASETPVTDGERLYAYFGMTGLFCYDLAGKPLWKKDLGHHPMQMGWGTGSSPTLDGSRLFVQCDNEEKSFLVALDAKTGDELWRTPREERSGWSTPYVWKNSKRTELVTAGSRNMRSYDPATGKQLWQIKVSGQASATPVGDADLLYVGTGGGMGRGPLIAIKAGAEGDLSEGTSDNPNPGVAWTIPRSGPALASPLLYQDCLYIADQRGGILSCYDAKTGKQHYRERLPSARGFTATPWAAGGKIFVLDEEGRTFVLEPGPKLKVIATNKLDDMFWSSVAVAGQKLLLRGVNHLYCIAQ